MDHATTPGQDLTEAESQPPELVRLRSLWGGIYSITCLDGVWSAYYIRLARSSTLGRFPYSAH